ncbi:hypothetical protein GUITHDRAFT_144236 [Guillardia theta CCMP2712]|uniref:Pentacotripeptide-repeat region of PRORP domain-containing protein n=1 Tax=Guillardia theta (strain CCMP2712) TaxID=905079 RepID=L1IRK7_GUITC|nr:hypothetical protein GUITHDRAFT_144236 [Guillardia theta CCMP2712]EKX38460.1 hypothetical protein GUITHDRAFT_144236 [Guillardia theta CCMP2712]|eukprot:XP_005825440.1 hypothetical protein GUITHDRAFT_144236 [Guillardia theta CCMP2712]
MSSFLLPLAYLLTPLISGHPLNLSRAARLIHSLSIERRVDESFQGPDYPHVLPPSPPSVFASSLESRVGANTGICHDLIDLATECSSPNKILQVYDCIQQRDIKIDTFHRHALVSLLCQMDAFVFAQEAMNGLAMGPQRANAESYLELVGAGFRAGSSEECLAIVKEFIQIAPRARRPTIDFFNFCLLVSCLLECKKYSRALMCYERMIELNFQPGSDLMNTYIECLAASKNPEHHELAWGMYLRLEALARARKILESAPGQDLYTKKARSQSDASRNSRTPVVSRLSSWNSMKQQQVGAVDGWLRLKHLLQTPSVEIPKAQVVSNKSIVQRPKVVAIASSSRNVELLSCPRV